MTVKENTSPSIMLQIVFWDLIIIVMSAGQKVRQRISRFHPESTSQFNPFKSWIIVLICLALGLYIGVLLGYFGI
jgi:cadmium resistance protein CadD (predicted permease)